jgi:hypothetical protein
VSRPNAVRESRESGPPTPAANAHRALTTPKRVSRNGRVLTPFHKENDRSNERRQQSMTGSDAQTKRDCHWASR